MLKLFYPVALAIISISSALSQTIIHGTVHGNGETVLLAANVVVSQPLVDAPAESVQADSMGEYRLVLSSRGVWLLKFSGAFHQDLTVAVCADSIKTIELNVELASYQYLKNPTELKLVGSFNKWLLPDGIIMQKQIDGKYVAEIKADSDRVYYQISGAAGVNIPGTESDRAVLVPYHGFNSELMVKPGKVRIVFDPNKLGGSDAPAKYKFSESDSAQARFADAYAQMMEWNAEYMRALAKSAVRRSSEPNKMSFDYESVLSKLKSEINNEPNQIVRQELELDYFMFALRGQKAELDDARRLLKEIPPSSVVWSLAPGIIPTAFDLSGYGHKSEAEYVQRVTDENPSVATVSSLLSNEFLKMLYGGDKKLALKYYDIVVNQYGDTPGGQKVLNYRSLSVIDTGKLAPKFSIRSLSNQKEIFSNKTFRGKYYLIDFWATSNQKSIDELTEIARATELFKDKNLQVLCVSLDQRQQALADFLKSHPDLPVMISFAPRGLDSKICNEFEVFAIPKSVLVSPVGKILAVGFDLRGEKLVSTLEKYLGKIRQ